MRLTNEFPNLYQFYILQANKFLPANKHNKTPNNIKREKKGKLHLFIIPNWRWRRECVMG